MMAVVEPIKAASYELIVIELPLKLSQTGSGVADHVIFVAVPRGFVTIVGSARVICLPI